MKFFEPIIDKLGRKQAVVETEPQDHPLYKLLDVGQKAKRAELLETALDHLTEAQKLAEVNHDETAVVVITLHRAETLIALGQWEEAEQSLLHLRRQAQMNSQHNHLTYALVTLGTMEESRGNWDEARSYYEQARSVAEKSSSTGGEGRALGHLAGTYLRENNASYAVHLLRQALPKLNISGDVELSSYFVGQLGRALILTGQEAEGERLLYRALRLAEQLNYRQHERRWALMLGQRAVSSMRYEEALQLYEQALKLFDTCPNPTDKIETLCESSRICLYLGKQEKALNYAQQALDEAEQDEAEAVRPIAKGTFGMVLRTQGRSAEAIPYLEQAVNDKPIDTPLQIEIMRNLATAHAETSADNKAIEIYEQVLRITQELPLELAQTHLELGLLYEQQQAMEKAIQHWKNALAIYEGERYHAQAARLYCDIGGARRWLGQGKRALKEYDQALMMLSSVNDVATRGLVISNAAIAYADLGDIESAEAFFKESIQIAQKLEDKEAQATRQGNYGWFLLSIGRVQLAIRQLEQALKLSKETGLDLQIAVQTDNLGLAYEALRQHDRALAFHQEALELIRPLDNAHWEAVIQLNIANTQMLLDHSDAAQDIFVQTLNDGRERSDVEVIARALLGQTRIALDLAQPQAAEELLEEAIHLTRQGDMRRLLAESLQLYSEQQAALNDSDRSLELWDEAQKLFSILHMPEAELEPNWIKETPAKTES